MKTFKLVVNACFAGRFAEDIENAGVPVNPDGSSRIRVVVTASSADEASIQGGEVLEVQTVENGQVVTKTVDISHTDQYHAGLFIHGLVDGFNVALDSPDLFTESFQTDFASLLGLALEISRGDLAGRGGLDKAAANGLTHPLEYYPGPPLLALFPLASGSNPYGITIGLQGFPSFAEVGKDDVGTVDLSPKHGAPPFPGSPPFITHTPGPPKGSGPLVIKGDAKGNLWVGLGDKPGVGRLTFPSTFTLFTAGLQSLSGIESIDTGPDGNMWFTDPNESRIGRITPEGQITEFQVPSSGIPIDITQGPDGNLWFTILNGEIGRITPAGGISLFGSGSIDSGALPWGITSGPGGALYFTEIGERRVMSITTSGAIGTVATLPTGSQPLELAAGPDQRLWVTDPGLNTLDRVAVAGSLEEVNVPVKPTGITAGADRMWWTSFKGDTVGWATTGTIPSTP